MPRKARITIPGAVHHVMSRGIDGMPIFRSDADRSAFLAILSNQLQKSGYQLYAWALMPNHYHLVLRTTDYPVAACMRSVNSRYAQYFRKQLSTRGYLFQDRYKSIVTQDQNYVEELIRYVHLNPVRAGICKSIDALDAYPWCGHSVLMGRQDAPYQNTADVLRRFGSSLVSQRQAYRRFLEEGLTQTGDVVSLIREANGECEDRHSSSCWVIGNHEFVQQVMKDQQARRVRLARHAREGLNIEHIAKKVAAALGLAASIYKARAETPRVRLPERYALTVLIDCTAFLCDRLPTTLESVPRQFPKCWRRARPWPRTLSYLINLPPSVRHEALQLR